MNLFDYQDYKAFVNDWIQNRAPKPRGELQRIAKALSVHSTLISHIFRGDGGKNLSLEQASTLCTHLGFSALETDYFLLLVQKAKAGSPELTRILDRQISEISRKSKDLVNRVPREEILTEENKMIFYSNWYYSGIRLLSSVPGYGTREAIQKYFGIPMPLIQETLDFLVRTGLCRFDGTKYSMGPAITHLESTSTQIGRHHVNWRLKAIEHHARLTQQDLVFTGPLTISKSDAALFREKLVQLIQKLGKLAKDSPEEELRCFNLDWVAIQR